MVLHCCMVLDGIALNLIVLHGIALDVIIFHGIVWYCIHLMVGQVACISQDTCLLHQVLHRLQNKEKPMQNNFDSPVRVTQNDFRVQHCKV